ncbi:NACHT and WD repeat domain-containing protein [Microbispora bryophytorum]|uniref:NACHT and WD repeat domain-containing protein n=1 Tax=Microbispora bryophytorum TaxID=1460882 RepID=UPI00340968C3
MSRPSRRPADHEDTGPGLHAEVSGAGNAYQAGRDQHFYYQDGVRHRRRARAGEVVDHCPYPGLAAFGPEQARWFFGRDRLLAELAARLDEHARRGGPLMVVAPSGAGKSSLLRAGLLPALEDGALPGSRRWPRLSFTPTARPMAALTTHLTECAGLGPEQAREATAADPDRCVRMLRQALQASAADQDAAGARMVVVVDQLEELFTQCADEPERHRFVDLITHLATPGPDGTPPVALVVCGLRSDFYTPCADYPRLRAALQDGQVFVGPMSQDELREAILYPAADVGLDIEPGLIELLLSDMGAGSGDGYEAGRLPLLAHALRITWQQRHGHTLTVAGYRITGGIQRAVATTAERIFTELGSADQQTAQALFLRLVTVGDGAEDTRRRVARDDLLGSVADSDSAAMVVDAFTQGRLLTRNQDCVEITHEALLHGWPRLRDWINDDRVGHLTHQKLEEAADEWQRKGHDPSLLYRGAHLETTRTWAATRSCHALTATAQAFLTASTRLQRRTQRLRTGAVAILAVLAVVASTAAVLAVNLNARASERERIATARQAAAFSESLLGTRADIAQLLAVQGYRLDRNPQTRAALFHSRTATPHLMQYMYATGYVTTIAASRNGNVIVAGTEEGRVLRWDVGTRDRKVVARLAGRVSSVATDGSGEQIVATDGETITRWRSGRHAEPLVLPPRSGAPVAVGVSPDGRLVIVAHGNTDGGFLSVWAPDSNRWWTKTTKQTPNRIAFPSSSEVALLDLSYGYWERRTLPELTTKASGGLEFGVYNLASGLSPDGTFIGYTNGDTTVPLWATRASAVRDRFKHPDRTALVEGSSPNALTISRNGTRLAVADTGTVYVAATRAGKGPTGGPPIALPGNGTVNDGTLLFLGDGDSRLVSASDNRLTLWDLDKSSLFRAHGHVTVVGACNGCPAPSIAIRPDGRQAAVVSGAGQSVALKNLGSPDQPFVVPPNPWYEDQWSAPLWSPDGRKLLLYNSVDETIDVRTPDGPGPIARWPSRDDSVCAMTWSDDARNIVEFHASGRMLVRDITTGSILRTVPTLGLRDCPLSVAISGRMLTATIVVGAEPENQNETFFVDMRHGTVRKISQGAWTVAYAGDRILIQYTDGHLEVRDSEARRIIRSLPGDDRYIGNVVSNGKDLVVRRRSDSTAVVTDIDSGSTLGIVQLSEQSPYRKTGMAFSPDGQTLVMVTEPAEGDLTELREFPMSEDSWIRTACHVAGRTMSEADWERYIGGPPPELSACTS